MNIATLSAALISLVVFIMGLKLSSDSLGIFYDFPSLFIVLGGTFSVAAITFNYKRLWSTFKIFVKRVFKGKPYSYSVLIKELIQSVDEYRKGATLKTLADKTKDHFFKEGLEMLDAGVVPVDQVISLLEERNNNIYYIYSEDSMRIKSLGKYPPAFGMMGTTIGMVVLLANLSGADAIKKVGPAMGICLITTLYGTVIANFLFIPYAENMIEQAKEIYLKNRIIIEGIKLISEKSNPIYAAEKLNSFLRPGERLDWKKALGMAG
jgi:chemotaxis protein MotA